MGCFESLLVLLVGREKVEPSQNDQGRQDPPQEPGLLKENDHGTPPQSVADRHESGISAELSRVYYIVDGVTRHRRLLRRVPSLPSPLSARPKMMRFMGAAFVTVIDGKGKMFCPERK